MALINQADYVSFDTETTSLDYMLAELVGISIALKPNEAFIYQSITTMKAQKSSWNRILY